MNSLGVHILIDIWGSEQILNEESFIESQLLLAAEKSGATILGSNFQRTKEGNIAGAVIIAESHLAAIAIPNKNYIAIDIFTCGDKINPWEACSYLCQIFDGQKIQIKKLNRGILDGKEKML